MKHVLRLFTLFFVFIYLNSNAQPGNQQQESKERMSLPDSIKSSICGFIYLPWYFFPHDLVDADSVTLNMVEEILMETGMHLNNGNKNFRVMRSNQLSNAMAIAAPYLDFFKNLTMERYIVYNSVFMDSISRHCSTAGPYVILAPEIAHHLNADNFAKEDTGAARRQRELNADSFAGYLCFRLGVSKKFNLDSCLAVYNFMKDTLDNATHPNISLRKNEFQRGWNTAAAYMKMNCEILNSFQQTPSHAIFVINGRSKWRKLLRKHLSELTAPQANATEISKMKRLADSLQLDTSVINLRGDSTFFILDQDSSLITGATDQENTLDKAAQIKLVPLSEQNKRTDQYLLDENNIIWAVFPNGVPYIVGHLKK